MWDNKSSYYAYIFVCKSNRMFACLVFTIRSCSPFEQYRSHLYSSFLYKVCDYFLWRVLSLFNEKSLFLFFLKLKMHQVCFWLKILHHILDLVSNSGINGVWLGGNDIPAYIKNTGKWLWADGSTGIILSCFFKK